MRDPVFINGFGVVSKTGVGIEAHKDVFSGSANTADDFSMSGFKAAPHLSDKKMLKAVSESDSIGLVAIEDLKKSCVNMLHEDPYQNGLYVGSPPGSALDNQYYADAMRSGTENGRMTIAAFGATCMASKPTTLLIGLPNNVLCYGSIILGIKGPNSNYTSSFLSGQTALINGARRVQRGQIATAIAGGFTMHSEAVNSSMYEKLGVASKDRTYAEQNSLIPMADGGVFAALSKTKMSALAEMPCIEFIDGALSSDGLGPLKFDPGGAALETMINNLLQRNSVSKESVGLLFVNSSGLGRLDACEKSVLSRVYANERVLPAVGCSRGVTGNMMEAGGLIELYLASAFYKSGSVPAAMFAEGYVTQTCKFTRDVDKSRPFSLVLRASPWGEYSAVLVKLH